MREQRYYAKRPLVIEGEIAYVPLAGKREKKDWAVIDARDAPLVAGFNWYLGRGGVQTNVPHPTEPAKLRTAYLHRMILNAPGDKMVDHADHNTRNNRRENLRLCVNFWNTQNRLEKKENLSLLRGVSRVGENIWAASIRFGDEQRYIGCFPSKRDAWNARRAAEIKLRGEFAPPLPDRLEDRIAADTPISPGRLRSIANNPTYNRRSAERKKATP